MTEDVRLIHGDCLEVMPTLEAGSIDAIVTDPPYGTQVDRDGYGRRHQVKDIGRFIVNDSDLSAFDGMLSHAGRVLARDGWVAAFCSPKRHREAAEILANRGLPVVGEVIWDKATPGLGGGIRYQHETILLAKKGNAAGRSSLLSVLRYFAVRNKSNDRHPHEKPVGLMTDIVAYCARPGDVVLDPFAGSGSTLVACLKTGRRGIGIELDPKYIEPANRRIEEARSPLFEVVERGLF